MKRILVIIGALLIVSCSGTPQQAVAEIQKAVNDRDWPALEELTEEKTLWSGDAQRVLELDESRGGILSALSMIDLNSVDVRRDGAIVELSAATYTYYGRERVNISMWLRKPDPYRFSRDEWKLLKVDITDYKVKNRALMDNTLLRYAIYDQVLFLNKHGIKIEQGKECGYEIILSGSNRNVTFNTYLWPLEDAEYTVHESHVWNKVRNNEDELGRGYQEPLQPMSYYRKMDNTFTQIKTTASAVECRGDASGKLIFIEKYSDTAGVAETWVVPDLDTMMRRVPWEEIKQVSNAFLKNNIYK